MRTQGRGAILDVKRGSRSAVRHTVGLIPQTLGVRAESTGSAAGSPTHVLIQSVFTEHLLCARAALTLAVRQRTKQTEALPSWGRR